MVTLSFFKQMADLSLKRNLEVMRNCSVIDTVSLDLTGRTSKLISRVLIEQ